MDYYVLEECALLDIPCHLRNIGREIDNLYLKIKDAVQSGLELSYNAINNIAAPIIAAIQNQFAGFWKEIDRFVGIIKGYFLDVAARVQQVYDWLVGKLGDLLTKLQATIEYWMNQVSRFFESVENWFKDTWAKIEEWAVSTWERIKDLYAQITAWITENVKAWIDGALDWIKAAFKSVSDWITDLSNKVWGWIEGVYEKIKAKVQELVEWIGDRLDEAIKIIEAGFKEMEELFSTLIEDAIRFMQDLWADVQGYLNNLFKLDEETFVRAFSLINGAMKKVVEAAPKG